MLSLRCPVLVHIVVSFLQGIFHPCVGTHEPVQWVRPIRFDRPEIGGGQATVRILLHFSSRV